MKSLRLVLHGLSSATRQRDEQRLGEESEEQYSVRRGGGVQHPRL